MPLLIYRNWFMRWNQDNMYKVAHKLCISVNKFNIWETRDWLMTNLEFTNRRHYRSIIGYLFISISYKLAIRCGETCDKASHGVCTMYTPSSLPHAALMLLCTSCRWVRLEDLRGSTNGQPASTARDREGSSRSVNAFNIVHHLALTTSLSTLYRKYDVPRCHCLVSVLLLHQNICFQFLCCSFINTTIVCQVCWAGECHRLHCLHASHPHGGSRAVTLGPDLYWWGRCSWWYQQDPDTSHGNQWPYWKYMGGRLHIRLQVSWCPLRDISPYS